MGLKIEYSLRYSGLSRSAAHRLVRRLHQRASAMPFESVGPVVVLPRQSAAEMAVLQRDALLRRLTRLALRPFAAEDDEKLCLDWMRRSAAEFIAFEVRPGRGCQPASFGLTRHRTTQHDLQGVPGLLACFRDVLWPWSHFSPWRWEARCETQFASNPAYGGKPNFAVCHLLVTGLLMRAELIGFDVRVLDQGGYWQSRSMDVLLQQVDVWNVATAGIVGGLQDLLGMPVRSLIKAFPDFEHLEAKFRLGSPPMAANDQSDYSAEANFDTPFGT